MTDIRDRLTDYPALSLGERADIDAFVATHPEWADAHHEARQLADLLDRARSGAQPIDVADAVVGQAFGQPMRSDLRQAVDADPILQAHADATRTRIAELAADMEDPLAQFERLTGRAATPLALVDVSSSPGADASSPSTTEETEGRRAGDRAPEPTVRPGRLRLAWARPLAYAAAVCLVAYAGLFVYSTQSLSDRDRLADLGGLADYEPLRLRGGEADDLDARLDVALDGVDDARRSTLGLFPRYDDAALDAVATNLQDIVSAAAPGSSVHEEALFGLARVRFAQDREAPARAALDALVDGGGVRAPEARRLLDALDSVE